MGNEVLLFAYTRKDKTKPGHCINLVYEDPDVKAGQPIDPLWAEDLDLTRYLSFRDFQRNDGGVSNKADLEDAKSIIVGKRGGFLGSAEEHEIAEKEWWQRRRTLENEGRRDVLVSPW
jgi:hypothetical protein